MKLDTNGGRWFKGNLHTHTTESDGAYTPGEAIALYKENGYDFLALTDHWRLSETKTDGGLLLLGGCEYDTGRTVQEGIFHIVGIGMNADLQLPTGVKPPVQQIIDGVRSAGGIAVLAHPAWSLNRPADVLGLTGLAGVEIYNSFSDRPWNSRPYSGDFVDGLAAAGVMLPCMAADDTHQYNGDQCRSYLMVRAAQCTRDAIIGAIAAGDFYATQGPDFTVEREGSMVHVECSPVRDVVFFSDSVYAADRVTRGDAVTKASYRIGPLDTFVRVELHDAQGRMAWSSPIRIR